jgi:hypothetical protein
MLGTILEGIIKLLLYLFVETIVLWTGDLLLYVLSLGKVPPDFIANREGRKRDEDAAIWTTLSFWVGMAFYASLVLILILASL